MFENLRYDEREGGAVYATGRNMGKRAGYLRPDGYRSVASGGKNYLEHRVVWFLCTGKLPDNPVDHRNLVKSDNRFGNLRECNRSQNQANRAKTRSNSGTLKGAYWHKKDKRWWSKIQVNGVATYLGQFDTPEEANAAYMVAATEAFGEFARAN